MMDNNSGASDSLSREILEGGGKRSSSGHGGGSGRRPQQLKKVTLVFSKKTKFLVTCALGASLAAIGVSFFLMVPEYRNMGAVQILVGGVPVLIVSMAMFALSNTTAVDTFD